MRKAFTFLAGLMLLFPIQFMFADQVDTKEGKWENDGHRSIVASPPILSIEAMCLACKMLPQCMGPCSQKCMERNWTNMESTCSLHAIDMSLEQYILLRCELKWIRKNKKQEEK